MSRRKISILLLVAVLIVMALGTACGSTNEKGEEPTTTKTPQTTTKPKEGEKEEEKEVSIVFATGGVDNQIIEKAHAIYSKEHPNFKMEVQTMDHDTYQQKINIMLQANNLPDLFWWNGRYLRETMDYMPDTITDLTPYWEGDEVFDTVTEAAWVWLKNKDGKIVGFPQEIGYQAWVHNKAIFDECGISIPKTDKELLAAVPILRSKGYTPIAYCSKEVYATWGYHQWMVYLGIMDKDQVQKIFVDHSIKLKDADYVETYRFIGKLAELGAFPENTSTLSYQQAQNMYLAGEAAMLSVNSPSFVVGTDVEKDTIFDWGISFEDSKYDQKLAVKVVNNGYAVGAATGRDPDKMKAIVDFNRWRFTPEGVLAALDAGNIMPVALPSDVDLSKLSLMAQQQLELLKDDYKPCLTAANAFVEAWNYDASYPAQFNTETATVLINGLCDGSIKSAEIDKYLAKGDEIIDEAIAAGVTKKD